MNELNEVEKCPGVKLSVKGTNKLKYFYKN